MTWCDVLTKAGFPTEAVVLDFETYFDKDYSLSKMSTIEYVKDSRFICTGLGVQRLGQDASFIEPDRIDMVLKATQRRFGSDLEDITVVMQNAKFDALVLQEHFGITPRHVVDLMDLDKMWDARNRHSLKEMAKRWKAPSLKGDTKQFMGYHYEDMDAELRAKFVEYTLNDVEIEAWLFREMMPVVVSRPEIELPVANFTLHMFLHPCFEIDMQLGERILAGMEMEMLSPMENLYRQHGLNIGTGDVSKNADFFQLLKQYLPKGETVPMKQGKRGLIPAFAKDDEGMRQLQEHSDLVVRALAQARGAIQSWPLHIAKVRHILDQARAKNGMIGAPLGYHNAHTGRWGGAEKINLQNLGGAGRGGSAPHELIRNVRHMLRAPKGYVLGVQDFSKVEAIGVAWQAGQEDLVEGFRSGADVYSELAMELFDKRVWKWDKDKDVEEYPGQKNEIGTMRGFGKDAILGAGFGLGASKFYDRCYANDTLRPAFDSGRFDMPFIESVIDTYRKKYTSIPAYWRKLEMAWRYVTRFPRERLQLPECGLEFWHDGGATFIRLPSGRTLRYPHATVNNRTKECRYHWGYLWGGVLTENVVQALCRDFIAEALLKLRAAGFWVVLTVHDEIVCNLPEADAQERLEEMGEIMCELPTWAIGFPLSTEGYLSEFYRK